MYGRGGGGATSGPAARGAGHGAASARSVLAMMRFAWSSNASRWLHPAQWICSSPIPHAADVWGFARRSRPSAPQNAHMNNTCCTCMNARLTELWNTLVKGTRNSTSCGGMSAFATKPRPRPPPTSSTIATRRAWLSVPVAQVSRDLHHHESTSSPVVSQSPPGAVSPLSPSLLFAHCWWWSSCWWWCVFSTAAARACEQSAALPAGAVGRWRGGCLGDTPVFPTR